MSWQMMALLRLDKTTTPAADLSPTYVIVFMKGSTKRTVRYKYSRFTGDDLDGLDLEDLLSKLSDLLLSSGFSDADGDRAVDEQSLQALHDAILEALLTGDLLPQEFINQLLDERS